MHFLLFIYVIHCIYYYFFKFSFYNNSCTSQNHEETLRKPFFSGV